MIMNMIEKEKEYSFNPKSIEILKREEWENKENKQKLDKENRKKRKKRKKESRMIEWMGKNVKKYTTTIVSYI